MSMQYRSNWLDSAREQRVADVATRLGYELKRAPSSAHCACPACGAERRHTKTHDRRGAVGIPNTKPNTWLCWQCDAAGDAIDFASHRLAGNRFRDLDDAGKAAVREFFGSEATGVVPAPPRPRTDVMPVGWENADTLYPPMFEVERLWDACGPVDLDDEAAGYLGSRGITGVDWVSEHDVARALPAGYVGPSWASIFGAQWSETGHRIIVPLFDYRGRMRSVLARSVEKAPRVKSAGTSGFQRRGLVMAGSYGREMLMHGQAKRWHFLEQFRLTIYEGEVDTIRGVSLAEDNLLMDKFSPAACTAVLGIFSGSFSRDIASRVPSGSTVVIATDDDEAGDKYEAHIKATIGDRVQYERRRSPKD